ncbi:tRNA lysidine(34) synthetase TilS [Rheinheimera salexigens]|uniref:tRNA(Ile)-lysidine synthase n=1 Tax=Rheinheimera salexigens TaxID=1628148 RepID=A0A1E7Q8Z2_9GAMM|nr:tRNA lysidine(34) synthetase TilS [Rheinheimera salexigens]OEY70561.1 tRNA lysidine(34) synthetase TilS [Rheinheimera salexigens]
MSTLSAEVLLDQLLQQGLQQGSEQQQTLQAEHQVVLALSGGLDSMVLLDLLAKARQLCGFNLQAVYINHGLSANAAAWAEFCQQQCAQRQVEFTAVSLNLEGRHNLEARARQARYAALSNFIQSDKHVLLTAHHADDQIETLLLALKRGAGPAGLSGIAATKTFAAGQILRPLLAFSQAQLQQYATEQQLNWVDDESNADTQYERNFIRHQVAPLLRERWPHFAKTASRSMQIVANMQQLADHYTEQFYANVVLDDCLQLAALAQYVPLQQDLLIRRWLAASGLNPSVQWLDTLYQTVIQARVDSSPMLMLEGYKIRRFADKLYKVAPVTIAKPNYQLAWQGESQLLLPDDLGQLHFMASAAETEQVTATLMAPSEALPLVDANASIVFGKLSLSFKPATASQHKPLKQWFKLWQVPPWQRLRVPLLLNQQQQLIAVVGYASAIPTQQAKYWLRWSPTAAEQK